MALPAQTPTRGAIVGTIVGSETGQPLPYSIVVLPALNLERFTSDSGAFRFTDLPPGPLLIRVRRLGYTPMDVTFPVRAGAVDTLRIQLNRIAVRLASVAVRALPPCRHPGPPDAGADSVLAAVYEQLRLNAQQFQTLSDRHPFTYVMETIYSRTTLQGEWVVVDSAYERFYSVRGWSYKPGQVVTRSRDARGRSSLRFNIPMLPDFADASFVANHCFHYGGLVDGDAGPLVRVDVVAAEKLKTPDVHGTMYLHPESFQVVRTELRLSRLPNVRGTTDMEVVTVFHEILPSIPVIQHAWSIQRFDPKVRGVEVLASHEEQSLAAFDFLGPRPGEERKP